MATGPATMRDLSLAQQPLLSATQSATRGANGSPESQSPCPICPVPFLLPNGTASLLQLQMSGVGTKTGASLTAVLNVSSSQASAGPRHLNNQCGKMDGVFLQCHASPASLPLSPGLKVSSVMAINGGFVEKIPRSEDKDQLTDFPFYTDWLMQNIWQNECRVITEEETVADTHDKMHMCTENK